MFGGYYSEVFVKFQQGQVLGLAVRELGRYLEDV
jgi:hypothetical protein